MKKLLAGILSTAILAGMLCGASASAEPDAVTGKADDFYYYTNSEDKSSFKMDELHNGFTISSENALTVPGGTMDQHFVITKEAIDLRTPFTFKYKLSESSSYSAEWGAFMFYQATSPYDGSPFDSADIHTQLTKCTGWAGSPEGGDGYRGFQLRYLSASVPNDPMKAPMGTVCIDGCEGKWEVGGVFTPQNNAHSGYKTGVFDGSDEQTLTVQLVPYTENETTLYKLKVVLNPDVERDGGAEPTVLECPLSKLGVNADRYEFFFGVAPSNGNTTEGFHTSTEITYVSRTSGATDVEDNKPTTPETTPETEKPTTAPTEAPKVTYKDLFYFVGDQNKMKIEDASNGSGFKLTASKLGNSESLFALSKNAVDLSKEFVITYTIPSVVVSEDMSSIQSHWAAFMFYLQNEATDSTAIIDPATITKTMWEEQGKHYGFQLRIATSGPDAGCLLIDGANGQTLVLAQANTLVENVEDLILHGSQNIDCGYDGKFTAASTQTMKVVLKPVVESDGRTIMHLQVTMNPDQPRKEGAARTIDVSLEKLGVPGDRTKFYFGLMPNNGDPNYPELTTSLELLTANQDILPAPSGSGDESKPDVNTGEMAWPLFAAAGCIAIAAPAVLVLSKKKSKQV